MTSQQQTTSLSAQQIVQKLQALTARHLWKYHKTRFYRYQWRIWRMISSRGLSPGTSSPSWLSRTT